MKNPILFQEFHNLQRISDSLFFQILNITFNLNSYSHISNLFYNFCIYISLMHNNFKIFHYKLESMTSLSSKIFEFFLSLYNFCSISLVIYKINRYSNLLLSCHFFRINQHVIEHDCD